MVYVDRAIINCIREDPPWKGGGVFARRATLTFKTAKEQCVFHAEIDQKGGIGPWYVPTVIPNVTVPIFSAEDARVLSWTAISFVFMVYLAFSLPITAAFEVEPTGFCWVLSHITTFFFLVDLPLNFLIAPYDDEGHAIKKPAAIARRYFAGWFWLDALTSIPWDWLPAVCGLRWEELWGIRMLRLTRLLRLVHTPREVAERINIEIESSPGMVFGAGLARIVLTLLAITHWSACSWFYLGNQKNGGGKTWVTENLTDENTLLERYMYSIYFTLTTMTTVGYGDITPQNSDEVLFGICLLIVASVVFAALLGSFSDLLVSVGSENASLAHKKLMLSQYRRARCLPRGLFTSLRHHVISMWDRREEGFVDFEESLKKELPPVLQRELCFHIFGPVLKNKHNAPFLAFMYDFDLPLKELACMVLLEHRAKGDFVFRHGARRDRIYMLVDGSARIFQNSSATGINIKKHFSSPGTSPTPSPSSKTMRMWRATREWQRVAPVWEAGRPAGTRAGNMPHFSRRPSLHRALVEQELQAVDHLSSNIAATMIQRMWRGRHPTQPRMRQRRREVPHSNTIKGRTVRAPAYFGETCLWKPYEEWDGDTSTFPYSLMCETVSEVVCLPRAAVQCVLEQFSPWLPRRFFSFQQLIAEGKLAEMNVGKVAAANGPFNADSDSDSSDSTGDPVGELKPQRRLGDPPCGNVNADSDSDSSDSPGDPVGEVKPQRRLADPPCSNGTPSPRVGAHPALSVPLLGRERP